MLPEPFHELPGTEAPFARRDDDLGQLIEREIAQFAERPARRAAFETLIHGPTFYAKIACRERLAHLQVAQQLVGEIDEQTEQDEFVDQQHAMPYESLRQESLDHEADKPERDHRHDYRTGMMRQPA